MHDVTKQIIILSHVPVSHVNLQEYFPTPPFPVHQTFPLTESSEVDVGVKSSEVDVGAKLPDVGGVVPVASLS